MRSCVMVGLFPILVGVGCVSDKSVNPGSSSSSTRGVPREAPKSRQEFIDPCDLITSEQIEAIQGEPVIDTKSSRRADGGLAYKQCFFSLADFARSVSLEVTQSDPDHASPIDLVQHWKQQFHRNWDPARKKGVPIKVEGIGDEAFWAGDARIGALYALKGQTYIRISVGGQDERSEKIETTKSLALKALSRL